ncbi:MAG: hypothetical protein QM499_05870 [Flavobacteriaceae bacterium]
MEYIYKKSLFEPKVFIKLTETSIIVEGNQQQIIPYHTLKKINLFKTPAFRGAPEQFFCKVKTNENKTIIFGNESFKKPLHWDNQSNQYVNFVNSLHKNIKDKEIVFEIGNGKTFYLLFKGFLYFSVIVFIVIAIGAFMNNRTSPGIIMGLSAVVFVFLTPIFTKGYKTGVYNPNYLPEEILPKSF